MVRGIGISSPPGRRMTSKPSSQRLVLLAVVAGVTIISLGITISSMSGSTKKNITGEHQNEPVLFSSVHQGTVANHDNQPSPVPEAVAAGNLGGNGPSSKRAGAVSTAQASSSPEAKHHHRRKHRAPSPSSPPLLWHHGDSKPLVSIITTYYQDPDTLNRRLEQYKGYHWNESSAIELIVVDDGSMKHMLSDVVPASRAKTILPDFHGLKLVMMNYDVGFNHAGALNTGVQVSTGRYVFFLDVDHFIPAMLIGNLFDRISRIPPVYRKLEGFRRFDSRVAMNKTMYDKAGEEWFFQKYMVGSPNTLLLERELFEELGGYDEDFITWGWEDQLFIRCTESKGLKIKVNKREEDRRHPGKFLGTIAVYDPDFGPQKDIYNSTSFKLMSYKLSKKAYCNKGPRCRVPYTVYYSRENGKTSTKTPPKVVKADRETLGTKKH